MQDCWASTETEASGSHIPFPNSRIRQRSTPNTQALPRCPVPAVSCTQRDVNIIKPSDPPNAVIEVGSGLGAGMGSTQHPMPWGRAGSACHPALGLPPPFLPLHQIAPHGDALGPALWVKRRTTSGPAPPSQLAPRIRACLSCSPRPCSTCTESMARALLEQCWILGGLSRICNCIE